MSAEISTVKRCPRCETTKHRNEFTSNGYCRPCSRDYSREHGARRHGSNPPPPKTAKPAASPSPPPATAPAETKTIADVARNVRARAAEQIERGTNPPLVETIRPTAETTAAPRETPLRGGVPLAEVMREFEADPVMAAHLVEARKIPERNRRLVTLAKLCAALVDVLDDGETITITASRYGPVILLRDVDVEPAP